MFHCCYMLPVGSFVLYRHAIDDVLSYLYLHLAFFINWPYEWSWRDRAPRRTPTSSLHIATRYADKNYSSYRGKSYENRYNYKLSYFLSHCLHKEHTFILCAYLFDYRLLIESPTYRQSDIICIWPLSAPKLIWKIWQIM
jgi:hypothetical protein